MSQPEGTSAEQYRKTICSKSPSPESPPDNEDDPPQLGGVAAAGYSEQIDVYRFTSIHIQHFFAAKHIVRETIRVKKFSQKDCNAILLKSGINLS